jgi:hypothetical protein
VLPDTAVHLSKLVGCTSVHVVTCSLTAHIQIRIHLYKQVVLFGDLDGRLHLWRLGKHFVIQGAHEAAIANATAAAAAAAATASASGSTSTSAAAAMKHTTAAAAGTGGTDVKSSHDVQIHSDTVMKVCTPL